jgi:hypothetical protein
MVTLAESVDSEDDFDVLVAVEATEDVEGVRWKRLKKPDLDACEGASEDAVDRTDPVGEAGRDNETWLCREMEMLWVFLLNNMMLLNEEIR